MTALFHLPMVRPKTRGECAGGPRPCPWVSCRYHLMLTVDRFGKVTEHFADIEDMRETCALDVADKGEPMMHGEIAALVGVSPQMAQQNDTVALHTLARRLGDGYSPRAKERAEELSAHTSKRLKAQAYKNVAAARRERRKAENAEATAAIFKALRNGPLSGKGVAAATRLHPTTVGRHLAGMRADGRLARSPGRQHEYLWSIPESVAAE